MLLLNLMTLPVRGCFFIEFFKQATGRENIYTWYEHGIYLAYRKSALYCCVFCEWD